MVDMILDDFFAAAAEFDDEALARVMHPEARFSEMPNAINRDGTERDRGGARRRSPAAGRCSRSRPTTSTSASIAGDTIAARASPGAGTLQSGQELTAHIATFTQVRDGKIFRHATYDCYESF